MGPNAQASNAVSKYITSNHYHYLEPLLQLGWASIACWSVSFKHQRLIENSEQNYNQGTRLLASNHRKLSITVWRGSQCPLRRHLALWRYHKHGRSHHRGLITYCDHSCGIREYHTLLERLISDILEVGNRGVRGSLACGDSSRARELTRSRHVVILAKGQSRSVYPKRRLLAKLSTVLLLIPTSTYIAALKHSSADGT